MKVVKWLNNENNREEGPGNENQHSSHYVKIKKFQFVMLLFLLVFITAGITTIALAFGDEKAVTVGVTERPEFQKLYDAYDHISTGYYKDIKKDVLVNGAINGMVKALDDPYSTYMNETEAKDFHQGISSSFEGIGAEIQEKDGFITIISPIKGSPAEKAGLKPNDRIIAVDGKSLHGMSSSEAVMLIRGKKGTKVTLSVQKEGSTKSTDISIVRDEIPIETVYSKMDSHKVATIQITSFSENTGSELEKAIADMKKQGMKGLVLDLRQNPGGLLDQAQMIANMFVPEGKVMFQVEDRKGKAKKYAATSGEKVDVPTSVLIDGGSASASEIVAAALHESADIPLIGEKSFGKGTVQTTEEFKDGSNMKYTIAKWLTPEGNWIHKKGIEPDQKVSLPAYAELPYINPDKPLKESDLSDEVKAAEQMLEAVGYNPGKADGFFDSETTKAVKAFQKSEKLTVDGVIKGETTSHLMNKIRIKIKENDTQQKKATEQVLK